MKKEGNDEIDLSMPLSSSQNSFFSEANKSTKFMNDINQFPQSIESDYKPN